MYLEILVEEVSAEVALQILLPRMIGTDVSFTIHPFQGKHNLLRKLPSRLRGYRYWDSDTRIVVLLDSDTPDCHEQKQHLEQLARDAGLLTKTVQQNQPPFQVINRLAVRELEAWFLGDMEAIRAAYPRVSTKAAQNNQYRNPDTIVHTWEALERLLQQSGYFPGGLKKLETARKIAQYMEPARNCSPSFQVFYQGLLALVS